MTITDIPVPDVESPVETKRQINLGPLAAARIREIGWWNGKHELGQTEPIGDCMWIALDRVAYQVAPANPIACDLAFIANLNVQLGLGPIQLCSKAFAWNDSHTAEEVIDFLDNAVLMVDVP